MKSFHNLVHKSFDSGRGKPSEDGNSDKRKPSLRTDGKDDRTYETTDADKGKDEFEDFG